MRDGAEHDGLRLTELVAAISLATDLGTGQPMEHALRTCLLSSTVADELGLDTRTAADVHHVALLRFLGCVADAPETAHLAGGDGAAFLAAMAPVYLGSPAEQVRALVRSVGRGEALPRRAVRLVRALGAGRPEASHCEVGARLATRLGLGDGVVGALAHAYERWDGGGPLGLAGEAVPTAVRVVAVARDALLWQRLAGTQAALEVLGRRRGRAYDPAVVDATRAVGLPDGDAARAATVWADVLAAEPEPVRRVGAVALDRALAAVGDFADLRSRWTRGRSARLAELTAAAGRACGLAGPEVATLRRAALVADLGAVGVPAGVWERAGPRATAGQLPLPARLLAAADVWTALGEDRAHRPAYPTARARAVMREEVGAGRLDREAVRAVLAAAGQDGGAERRRPRPAGLSGREVEVLALIARGCSNRDAARRLSISVKTVGHHVGHIYAKIGVTTRPAAALFAMEHDLLGG